jgi:hypothetical protein
MNPQASSFGMVIDHLHRSQEKRWEHLIVFADEIRGDCPAGTIATRASPEPASGLGHSASVNYRKGSNR